MGRGGGQGGGAVSVKLFMLIMFLLFILVRVMGASIMMGWGLEMDTIDSSGTNKLMLEGEGVINIECEDLKCWYWSRIHTMLPLKYKHITRIPMKFSLVVDVYI